MSTIKDLPSSAVPLRPLKPGRIRYSYTWRVPWNDIEKFMDVSFNMGDPLQHPFDPGLVASDIYGESADPDFREANITVKFAPIPTKTSEGRHGW